LKMLSPDLQNPLIVIVGPTAVGKTEISIQLAERFGGEIVSADSRLFYRGMDIGTAKPTAEELRRVPHHLIDVAAPDNIWGLAVFQKAAHAAITEIQSRGRLPFLVGGTGQYVRAVIETWDLPAQEPDFAMRAILEAWAAEIGPLGLHQKLALIDPQAAARIDPNNVRRTVRALEVIFHTGKRFSDQGGKKKSIYSVLQIGFIRPRPELYSRIDLRIEQMLKSGFMDEVQVLLNQGYAPDLPTLSAIGYREMIAHLQGKMSLEDAVIQMKRLTRVFVRRQANWFNSIDPNINWFQVEPGTVDRVEQFIRSGKGWIPTEE
jgi:tRNA dimethylallyltransferase